MDDTTTSPPPPPESAAAVRQSASSPLMSRSKQTRIDIWRNEVAVLATDDELTTSSPASTTSSTSSSRAGASGPVVSATAAAAVGPSAPLLPGQSRGRRLWRRISRRITGRPFLDPDDVWDPATGTGMYRTTNHARAAALALVDEEVIVPSMAEQPAGAAAAVAAVASPAADDDGRDDQHPLGADSSPSADGHRGLKDTQERLERAARLLHQGAAPSRDA